jgi:hypothetical protein
VNRATQVSRIVFALLALATLLAFVVAQQLKQSDPLVNSVFFERYISPNNDKLHDVGRVRFRTKKRDRVTVQVIDHSGSVVRVLADAEPLPAGRHSFYWNGRQPPRRSAGGEKRRGRPVPDGSYRVRISLRNRGRSFVPSDFFIVDTVPPRIKVNVRGKHIRSILRGRDRVVVKFSGTRTDLRAEFSVYRTKNGQAAGEPVASFLSRRGSARGGWLQTVGDFSSWRTQCRGIRRRGRARGAPVGSYVIVARACDAAGNVGSSSTALPPRRDTTRGHSGVTLTGVQIAPLLGGARAGRPVNLRVAAPLGGYSWKLLGLGGEKIAAGSARGGVLRVKPPKRAQGLYVLRVAAREPVEGDRGVARTPLTIARERARLLIAHGSIAWQAANPVDTDGDGFADPFDSLPPGTQQRVPLDRLLARSSGPVGFATGEAALTRHIESAHASLKIQTTTDAALAADPAAALRGHDAVLFTGDERWITASLGTELRRFVMRGGKVAFFASEAFRRTVVLGAEQLTGPSDQRGRDIFGESTRLASFAAAPVVEFKDELGLLRGPTGLFTSFEQSQRIAPGAKLLTAAGRSADRPALVAYRLGKGTVIRVGVPGWSKQLAAGDPNVAWTTDAIVEVLSR